MEFITELLHNRIFVSAALGWMVAQVLKTIIHMILTKQFVAERMVGSGGMPSSHSATVCALATATGMECGAGSPEFAITIMLAIIVMYDAMGVRRETGKQGRVLNEMLEIFTNMEVLQNFTTPFSKDVMSVALPIVGLPDSLLKKALEKAVEEENYEGASFIRDEMKRRQEEKDEKNLND